ncbi:MAG TPA: ABC transporter permease subunit, partial [Blastocatellia bacterium]|nr:ABC transporter permease subunit [Blastocatellia bacterium]
MDFNAVTTIARQELIINIRNKWTVIFAGVFGVLVLAISYFGLATAGSIGFQGFARTSASLLNLVLYLVPLVSLIMGTLSFTSEKTTGEMLFAQPVSRSDILAGKIAGLFASIFTATLIGFGLAGIVISVKAG